MIKKHILIGGLAVAILLIGAGCNLGSLYQPKAAVTNTAVETKLSETEYYNKVIQQLNGMSDETTVISDQYQRFVDAADVTARADFNAGTNNYTWYDSAKKTLVDERAAMENAEAQTKIEEKLVPYLAEYKTMVDAKVALGEYYERGRYKDDNEAQKDTLSKALGDALDQVVNLQKELFDLVESYQDQVDLGIDENTQDPLEVVTLAQTTITKDAEKLWDDYSVWIEAYSQDAKADTTTMQADYDLLMADIAKFKTKADAVNVKDQAGAASSPYEAYLEDVEAYTVKFENILRDVKNNNVGDLVELDEAVVSLYNDIIDSHNRLVQSVELEASLPK